MKVAVVGAGSWGTALAQVLATAGNQVLMWARKESVATGITEGHRNPRYLVDAELDHAIRATTSLVECVRDAEAVVVVTPSSLLRQFAQDMKSHLREGVPIVICSKGIEEGTALLPVEVFAEVLGSPERLAALSGPNHAEEVVYGLPAGTVIASTNQETAILFRDLFATDTFRCYVSDDVVGVELCAAFKNVIAIAVGASYGMGYGDNTAALMITRGMAEMSRLAQACGGHPITVMGLAGAGDLIATCTSEHSRNRTFGKMLAQGGTLEQFQEETHMVVEGALACKTIMPLAKRHDVELPIANAVRALLWEGATLDQVSQEMLSRPLTTEFWGLES